MASWGQTLMRKFFLFFLLIFLFPLYAQIFTGTSDWHLEVEPRIGMTYGSLGEYLYMKKSDGSWKKNSFLEWEEKPLWTYGLEISGSCRAFRASACVDAALPLRSGSMMDSDWKLDDRPDIKTNYSIHENTSTMNIRTGLSLACDFSPLDWLTISPLAQAEYAYRSFEARNGEGWYGDTVAWDDPSATHYPGTYNGVRYILAGLDYQFQTLQIFAGLQFTFMPLSRLRAGLGVFVSPYSYSFAEDRHYTNKARTTGRYYVYKAHSHFSRYKASLFARYQVTSVLEVGLALDAMASDIERAGMYDEDPETEKIYKTPGYEGGFSLAEFSIKLSAKVHIF